MDRALRSGHSQQAAALAQVVLKRYPRHLSTYQRVLHLTWTLERWQECRDWGLRLLHADPINALAWAAVAMTTERQSAPSAQAQAQEWAYSAWYRTFELDPYNEQVRGGLQRTRLHQSELPAMNLACLASLYIRRQRWQRARTICEDLVQANPSRPDLQISLLLCLWQLGETTAAHDLSRLLTRRYRNLLAGWLVLGATGDETDRAIAQGYLSAMDPDGEYAARWLGTQRPAQTVTIAVTTAEAALLSAN